MRLFPPKWRLFTPVHPAIGVFASQGLEYTCATRLFYCAVSTKTEIQATQLEPPEDYSAQIHLIERMAM